MPAAEGRRPLDQAALDAGDEPMLFWGFAPGPTAGLDIRCYDEDYDGSGSSPRC